MGIAFPKKVIAYLNGKQVANIDLPADFAFEVAGSASKDIDKKWIFSNYSNGDAFHGLVNELIIYNRMLTSDEFWKLPGLTPDPAHAPAVTPASPAIAPPPPVKPASPAITPPLATSTSSGSSTDAPDFTVADVDGKPIKLSDYRGKVVVLDFWANWCGPCQASLPHTEEIAAQYAKKGVIVLAVNVWDAQKAFDTWIQKNKQYLHIKFAIDTKGQGTDIATSLYKVHGIPTQVIIDPAGKIVHSIVGYSGPTAELANAIDSAGAAKKPATIFSAAALGDAVQVARLLDADSKLLNAVDPEFGGTPLHWAAVQGRDNVVKLLLQRGADVNSTNNDTRTPLHLAAASNCSAVVSLLLDNGAVVNCKYKDGNTPLHLCAANAHQAIVPLLLAKRADKSLRNNANLTPGEWAFQLGNHTIVAMLNETP